MEAACPYTALKQPQRLPPTLVTLSTTDARVPYWCPLKWAARARAMSRDPAPVHVAPDLHLGHGAAESERSELTVQLATWAAKAMGLLEPCR